MEEKRVDKALARIEAAAKRIEAAASRPAAPQADPQIAAKTSESHEILRREAWAALADLDGLIEVLEA